MKEERSIVMMNGQDNIFLPSDTGAITMTEWEIHEPFGVIAPAIRTGIKALCENRVLSVYSIKRIICLSDRYSAEIYNLETTAILAPRTESFETTKVHKTLLGRVMHVRKEKVTVFVPLFTDCIPEKHWQV